MTTEDVMMGYVVPMLIWVSILGGSGLAAVVAALFVLGVVRARRGA